MKKLTNAQVIEQIEDIHGKGVYGLDKFEYKGKSEMFILNCPFHGDFKSSLRTCVYRKEGCPKCRGIELDTSIFIERCKDKHNNFYDYSKTNYVNSRTKVIITCPTHGDFTMNPSYHLLGQNCKHCNFDRYKIDYKKDVLKFIEEANFVHGNFYDYSLVDYKNNKEKVTIICPKHGNFEQMPCNHIGGKGCIKCGHDKISAFRSDTLEIFIDKARAKHGDLYDYSESEYNGCFEKTKIKCKKHGIFLQTPAHHVQGTGCPECSMSESKWEREMREYVESLGVTTKKDRSIINPYEIDILIPDKNVAIEANGLYFHSVLGGNKSLSYHYDKMKKCEEKGINLIQFFEDEWHQRKDIVKSIIKNKLKLEKNVIYARKCVIKQLELKETQLFLDENHLQGNTGSSIKLGLMHNNELVSVMTFVKALNEEGKYELNRFANKMNTIIVGGANKLFGHFIKNYNPKCIISFADLRISKGEIYRTLGFVFENEKTIKKSISYYYTNDYVVKHHKRNFQHSKLKNKLDKYNPSLSEDENMRMNGYDRIYDCGRMRFVWKNN